MPRDRAKRLASNLAYRARRRKELAAKQRAYRQENREERTAYDRAYYQSHREEASLYGKKYHAAHREEHLIRLAQYRQEHPTSWSDWYANNREARLLYLRNYDRTHQDEHRAYDHVHRALRRVALRLWRKRHPMTNVISKQRRRARKAGSPRNDLTMAQWRAIKAHYGHRCVYCGQPSQRVTQDHITPLSKGGAHTVSNVVPACQSCNSRKHVGPPLCPVQPLLFAVGDD